MMREGTNSARRTNRVPKTRIDDEALILEDDIFLEKRLVLNAKVIGEVAVEVEGSSTVRQDGHGTIETNLQRRLKEKEKRREGSTSET
jgi:hypothetical protein